VSKAGGTDKLKLLVRENEGRAQETTDKLRLSVPPVRITDNGESLSVNG
jgi:hypothetical protein